MYTLYARNDLVFAVVFLECCPDERARDQLSASRRSIRAHLKKTFITDEIKARIVCM